MKTAAGLAALAALALSAAAAPEGEAARKASAEALVAALAKGDFAAAGKDFDDAMTKALPEDKRKETWAALQKQLGPFKKQAGVRAEQGKKYLIVYVTCRFEKADLDAKVVFDGAKVTGLFFVPAKSAHDFKAPPYARPESFREVAVVVGEGGDWPLPGALSLPKGGGPSPAVVLLHGSGPQDRDETIGPNKPLRDLAWGLASQGIAVLRYEKRTRAHGRRWKASMTFRDEVVDDALAAAALVRKRPEVDGKRVVVLGHSLGAVAAPEVGRRDPSLAGLVLLAGNTRPLEDVILDQLSYVLPLQTDKDTKEELEKIRKQVARVKDRKLTADTPASELPLKVPAAYWLALREYDPAATAARLKLPVLVLQGERDYQVTMADFDGWKKALAGRKDVRLKSYPKLNHLFMEGEGKAKPAEYEKAGHVSREVVDDIAAWVKGR